LIGYTGFCDTEAIAARRAEWTAEPCHAGARKIVLAASR